MTACSERDSDTRSIRMGPTVLYVKWDAVSETCFMSKYRATEVVKIMDKEFCEKHGLVQ